MTGNCSFREGPSEDTSVGTYRVGSMDGGGGITAWLQPLKSPEGWPFKGNGPDTKANAGHSVWAIPTGPWPECGWKG